MPTAAASPGRHHRPDNLVVHHIAAARELVESAGAELLYLPPYSPEFNPIELAWALLKQDLRTRGARTLDLLIETARQTFESFTPELCKSWLEHCGWQST